MMRLNQHGISTLEAAQRYPEIFSVRWRQRAMQSLAWGSALAALLYGLVIFDFSPVRIWNGIGQLGMLVRFMVPPATAPSVVWEFLQAIFETLAMAFLGTLFAALLAIPFAFLSARNVFRFRLGRFGVRRGMDFLRGVDQLVWALVFVRAVGLGPLAGVLAIIISDIGTLAKLFSEAVEGCDRKPGEGVAASGGNTLQCTRFGILPQVLPMFISSTLYIFESNVRSATILGIVGAGGIGYQLSERIRGHHWEEVATILILILVTVYLIDWVSGKIRGRLIEGE
ncbi:phosphonate ABC transporter, permease protein PhnE [Billgrantia kenyensis]|uniref:Phosphonate ABC transporter, permease protein PhnE n=1 Tax=Billgrantia kenyensis TaxID=321266 RepID=A0A7V9W1I7_9GAMM|nr:phosphonate ABC transporter, permease protein PhnE [Halomonas kenyensis]MBA2779339.1 phosphonate ABC transporter, permease protein PhnE [Halomonas kenyensis]MCG6662513.1 phosphonate ABC transporter, permease protein PhnE [Halomonas kenyensis]